ncbi:MAG: hypothetical protein CMO66_06210 [Verrucomicrobiales bacterium]|nr:hypothetical protein [Verrucomicrobiales bacterium]
MLESYELFVFMSPELALRIIEDTAGDNKEVYQATLSAVAQVQRVRPVFLKKQPKSMRHKMMLKSLTRPGFNEAASGLIRGWLLKNQVEMVRTFLDKLGIEHEDGVVENLPHSMEDNKLNAAIDTLLASHDKESVILYLHAFHTMNEAGWGNLEELLAADERLQF